MHIMETIVDRRETTLVGNVFVNLDLATQIFWANDL